MLEIRLLRLETGQAVEDNLAHGMEIGDLVIDVMDLRAAHVLAHTHALHAAGQQVAFLLEFGGAGG